MHHQQRNAGLDLLRSCAIVPVIVYHTPLCSGLTEQLGFIGVEIFFVLSGFLVAAMIYERFDMIGSANAFAAFLANRWIRTFPLYFLFLGLNVLIARYYGVINPGSVDVVGNFTIVPDLGPYLVFAQNLTQGGRAIGQEWFGASWTLSIEEWFYVLLPTVLLLAGLRGQGRDKTHAVIALCAVLIGFSLLARASRYWGDATLPFDDMYRRVLLLRLDTFCFGILAYVFVTGRRSWLGLDPRRHATRLLIAGEALATLTIAAYGTTATGPMFERVFYLSLIPLSVALMLPAFHGMAITNARLAAFLKLISTRTYALYLGHLPVGLVFTVWIAPVTLWTLPLLLLLNLAWADLIYRLIERPILQLRPKAVMGAASHPASPMMDAARV